MSTRGFKDFRAYGTRVRETAYGDGLSVMDATWNAEPGPTVEGHQFFDNGEEVTTLEDISEQVILSRDFSHSHVQRATAHAIAFFGAAAFGVNSNEIVVTTTAGDVHRTLISLTSSPGILPTFGYVEDRGGLGREYNGAAVGRFKISGERNAHVMLEADVMASGSFVAVNTVRPALLTAEPYLRVSECKVWLGTGAAADSLTQSNTVSDISGSPTALDTKLQSFEFELNSNLMGDDGYGFGTGESRAELERDSRALSLNLNLEVENDSAQELDRMDNQTNLGVSIDVVSGIRVVAGVDFFYGFNLLFPRVRYKAIGMEGGRGKQLYNLECVPLRQVGSADNLQSVMLSVWNAQSVYLQT